MHIPLISPFIFTVRCVWVIEGSDGASAVDVYPRAGAGGMNEYADLTWVFSVMWKGMSSGRSSAKENCLVPHILCSPICGTRRFSL